MNREQVLVLQLAVSDVQKILNALSERPHREVSLLISILMKQVQGQLADAAEGPTSEIPPQRKGTENGLDRGDGKDLS